MDVLKDVGHLGSNDASGVDINAARNALHREIAQGERSRSRGSLFGWLASGGVAVGAAAVGIIAAGAFVTSTPTPVAPPEAQPHARPAAATILTAAATRLTETTIPGPGQYLKITSMLDQYTALHDSSATIEPFRYELDGAIGTLRTRWITTLYLPEDAALEPIMAMSQYQPVEPGGDVEAVKAAWDAYYGEVYGYYDDIIDNPRPVDVWETTRTRFTPLALPTFAESEQGSAVDDWGAYPTQPTVFLDTLLSEMPPGTNEHDAIVGLFETIVRSDITAAEPAYIATVLNTIALSDDLTIESDEAGLTTLRLDTAESLLRIVVDNDSSRIVELSERMYTTYDENGDTVPTGTTPLLSDDAPTTIHVFTYEVVDAPPAITTQG